MTGGTQAMWWRAAGPVRGRSRWWLLVVEIGWYLAALATVVVGRAATLRPVHWWWIEYWVMTALAVACGLAGLARWWRPRWTGLVTLVILALGMLVLAVLRLGPLGPLRLMLSVAVVPVLLTATARRGRWPTVVAALTLATAGAGLDGHRGGNTLSNDLAHWLISADPTPQFVLVTGVLLVVAPVAIGLLLRATDTARHAEALARRAESLARIRAEERLRVARDVHDLVANHVTGIILTAQAAGLSPDLPGPTARSLEVIEGAGNRALAAMQRVVGALRSDATTAPDALSPDALSPDAIAPDGATAPETTPLAAVHAAIGHTQDLDDEAPVPVNPLDRPGGHHTAAPSRCATSNRHSDVHLTVSGDVGVPVAADVGVTVHRIVAEALTNARRHMPTGSRITIELSTPGPSVLAVQVVNELAAAPARVPSSGYGLLGLRERAAAVGGHLDAGPIDPHHWRLRAELPY